VVRSSAASDVYKRQTEAEEPYQDSPLLAALKASLEASGRDLLSEEAAEKYAIFKNLLDQEVEASRRELANC
jgi:hypothetical protein